MGCLLSLYMTSLSKMAASIPPLPAGYKQLQHYIKTAQEHEQRYPVVSYYCEYVMQVLLPLLVNFWFDKLTQTQKFSLGKFHECSS